MHVADRPCQVRGEGEEARQFERATGRAGKGLAAVVIEDESWRRMVAMEREWSSRPAGIELAREGIFVFEARDTSGRAAGCHEHKYGNRIARRARAIEREVPVFAQRFEFASSDIHGLCYLAACAVQRRFCTLLSGLAIVLPPPTPDTRNVRRTHRVSYGNIPDESEREAGWRERARDDSCRRVR
jgi:hypothetical protein